MPTNTKEPTTFRAGETVTWEKSLVDYPADTWTLKYTLSGNAGGAIAVKSATGSGNTHTFTYTPTETAGLAKGIYKLFIFAEKTTDNTQKFSVSTTTVQVLPNLFTTSATDQRSDNQIILDAIIAVIKGRATKAHTEIGIAGRNIMLLSPAELYKWQKFYEYEVKKEIDAEKVASGNPAPRILQRFTNPL